MTSASLGSKRVIRKGYREYKRELAQARTLGLEVPPPPCGKRIGWESSFEHGRTTPEYIQKVIEKELQELLESEYDRQLDDSFDAAEHHEEFLNYINRGDDRPDFDDSDDDVMHHYGCDIGFLIDAQLKKQHDESWQKFEDEYFASLEAKDASVTMSSLVSSGTREIVERCQQMKFDDAMKYLNTEREICDKLLLEIAKDSSWDEVCGGAPEDNWPEGEILGGSYCTLPQDEWEVDCDEVESESTDTLPIIPYQQPNCWVITAKSSSLALELALSLESVGMKEALSTILEGWTRNTQLAEIVRSRARRMVNDWSLHGSKDLFPRDVENLKTSLMTLPKEICSISPPHILRCLVGHGHVSLMFDFSSEFAMDLPTTSGSLLWEMKQAGVVLSGDDLTVFSNLFKLSTTCGVSHKELAKFEIGKHAPPFSFCVREDGHAVFRREFNSGVHAPRWEVVVDVCPRIVLYKELPFATSIQQLIMKLVDPFLLM